MSLLLEGTNASEVNAAISAERHRLGATSTGMVLTFVIITDELHQSEATRAATAEARRERVTGRQFACGARAASGDESVIRSRWRKPAGPVARARCQARVAAGR